MQGFVHAGKDAARLTMCIAKPLVGGCRVVTDHRQQGFIALVAGQALCNKGWRCAAGGEAVSRVEIA